MLKPERSTMTLDEAMAQVAAGRAWAKALTDEQLNYALQEMRNRGWAVTAYDVDELAEMFDIKPSKVEEAKGWFLANRGNIEEALCEEARSFIKLELDDIDALGTE